MKKLLNDRGFSLVELVIVIAIMAILVALLAPQYIKFVEKSKLAADDDYIANIHNIIVLAVTDENIVQRPIDGISLCNIENMDPSNTYADFMNKIMTDMGTSDLSTAKDRLKSTIYKGQPIQVEIGADQQVTVTVVSHDGRNSLSR